MMNEGGGRGNSSYQQSLLGKDNVCVSGEEGNEDMLEKSLEYEIKDEF